MKGITSGFNNGGLGTRRVMSSSRASLMTLSLVSNIAGTPGGSCESFAKGCRSSRWSSIPTRPGSLSLVAMQLPINVPESRESWSTSISWAFYIDVERPRRKSSLENVISTWARTRVKSLSFNRLSTAPLAFSLPESATTVVSPAWWLSSTAASRKISQVPPLPRRSSSVHDRMRREE